MAWNTVYDIVSAEKGLQNLVQGRVLLKSNMVALDTLVPVGEGTAGTAGAVTGVHLFLNTTNSVKLVQPNAAGTGIEHSENGTITAATASDLNLTLTSGCANAYTTARGAYVTPQSLPASISALKVVDIDPWQLTSTADLILPAIYIEAMGGQLDSAGHPQYEGHYRFNVKYVRKIVPGEASNTTITYAQDIINLIAEDHYWGAEVDYGWPISFRPMAASERMSVGTLAGEVMVSWVEIQVEALTHKDLNKL